MKYPPKYLSLLPVCLHAGCASLVQDGEISQWQIDSTAEWQQSAESTSGLSFNDGLASPVDTNSHYRSVLHRFGEKRAAESVVFQQSPEWRNWESTGKVLPVNLADAPVLVTVEAGNYWAFGLYQQTEKWEDFVAEPAELEGFDVPLRTTPFSHQFDAPGGLRERLGGYHAWQSHDMVNWVHHGPVSEHFSRWVTTAEFVDGALYLYYDFPNDQDPHLYIDTDLTDGLPGKDMGMAFKDPCDGSDCTFIRDLDGNFHVIYEDWSPINARKHSWDSPLAGHAVSPDGIGDFEILPPAVDLRTEPTGRFDEYPHPYWYGDDPENYTGKPFTNNGKTSLLAYARYEIHEPEQDAFGDWAAISIGGHYYLFGDYHPAHGNIRIGMFHSLSLDEPFTFFGELGEGHPDPDIAFADGRFYLVNQTANDYVSSGPWVERVDARAGVDTDNDGSIDVWTDWQEVKETYALIPGFSKQISRSPAALDVSHLPEGYGFCFEFRSEDVTTSGTRPIMDRVTVSFRSVD